MAMKVADTPVHFYRSCSVSIFGRKEMKLPFFFYVCFFSMRVESSPASIYCEQWSIQESSWAYDNIFQGHSDVGWLTWK